MVFRQSPVRSCSRNPSRFKEESDEAKQYVLKEEGSPLKRHPVYPHQFDLSLKCLGISGVPFPLQNVMKCLRVDQDICYDHSPALYRVPTIC